MAVTLMASIGVLAAPAAQATQVNLTTGQKVYANTTPTLGTVSFASSAGQKFSIVGKVYAGQATQRLLVGITLKCDGSTKSQASRNAVIGGSTFFTYVRAIWAPAAGNHSCSIEDNTFVPGFEGASQYANDYWKIQSGSYLDASLTSSGAGSDFLDADIYLANGQDYDAAVLAWTAPAGATQVNATSDINVTNCIAGSDPSVCVAGSSTGSAIVESVFQVLQWNTAHTGYCKGTNSPASGLQTSTISWGAHHYRISQNISTSISTAAGCSRDFRIKTYVKSASGNGVAIQHWPYSDSIAIPS